MISSYGYHQPSVIGSTSTIILLCVYYLSHNLCRTTALFWLSHPFYLSTMFGFHDIDSSEICSFKNSHSWYSWQMSQRYHSLIWNMIMNYQQTKSWADMEIRKIFYLDNIIDPPHDDGEMNLIKQSPYFVIDCLPLSLVHTRGKLYILSIDTQSLNSKYDELVLLLNIAHGQNIRFHVICVQETWLSETSDYSLVAIDGYICTRVNETHAVTIAVSERMSTTVMKSTDWHIICLIVLGELIRVHQRYWI